MSPIASTLGGGSAYPDMFNRALAELDVDKKARDAGVRDQPSPNSTEPDANERQFISYFSDKIRERRNLCESTLSRNSLDRTATSSKIDISQTRSSLSSLFNSIGPDLARMKQDYEQDLEIAKDREARSLRYLRYFQQEHGLQNREVDPRPDPLWHFALVAAFAVVEWIALSVFYAEGSDFGLLGGILMAMFLSMINIGLAVFTGAILRYVNHRSFRRKVLGILGALILIFLFLFSTGFAAHYRNAAREVAATAGSQQQSSSQSMLYQAGKTAIPISSSDDDQWRASKLAWEQFRQHGFIFTDVLSWLLVILAILFGIIASWKGYGIDDRYPGYGPTSRRYEDNKAAYEAEKKKYTESVDGLFRIVGSKQQDFLRNVVRDIEYFQDLASKSESEVGQYMQFAQQALQTCNDIVFRYRDRNRHVATGAAPAYFQNQVILDSALFEPPLALSDKERSLLNEYAAAIREFTELVTKDDAQRQVLRTSSLEKLNESFERIERAINAKLAQEAQLYRA